VRVAWTTCALNPGAWPRELVRPYLFEPRGIARGWSALRPVSVGVTWTWGVCVFEPRGTAPGLTYP